MVFSGTAYDMGFLSSIGWLSATMARVPTTRRTTVVFRGTPDDLGFLSSTGWLESIPVGTQLRFASIDRIHATSFFFVGQLRSGSQPTVNSSYGFLA
ncbi:hypothetical protein Hanom_Chr03g00194471 [Helianthus anomalus]